MQVRFYYHNAGVCKTNLIILYFICSMGYLPNTPKWRAIKKPLLYFYDKLLEWRFAFIKRYCHATYANILFKNQFGRDIDWKHPRDLNEVINYLAFNTDTTEWSRLADKYRVREFVKERGCEDILVPLYGKWDNVNDIDYNLLPDSFVLKTNHGGGCTIIVKNKRECQKAEIKQKLNNSLSVDFGALFNEPHYSRIKPCIIAEGLLGDGNRTPIDYKVWCFNGKPYCVFTASNRVLFSEDVDFNVYDLDWNKRIDAMTSRYINDIDVQKPILLNEMLHYAELLSMGFPQVRVDFYIENDHVYFGEMTFTSQGGRMDYFTQEYLRELGSQVII